jgi:hypothetical protein
MSGRYFTNTRAFEDQDFNDLSRNQTYQPNEYWIVWPEGSTGQPEAGEEGWREATEEEFRNFYDDLNAVTHVIAATSVVHSRTVDAQAYLQQLLDKHTGKDLAVDTRLRAWSLKTGGLRGTINQLAAKRYAQ